LRKRRSTRSARSIHRPTPASGQAPEMFDSRIRSRLDSEVVADFRQRYASQYSDGPRTMRHAERQGGAGDQRYVGPAAWTVRHPLAAQFEQVARTARTWRHQYRQAKAARHADA